MVADYYVHKAPLSQTLYHLAVAKCKLNGIVQLKCTNFIWTYKGFVNQFGLTTIINEQMSMYSSYASLKYEIFAFDLGNIVLYSTRGYLNLFPSSISFINNIFHSTSLIEFLNRDYSFSHSESASITTAKFSCFLNSEQQLSLLQWPEP